MDWGYLTICPKSHANGEHRESIVPSKSRLPLRLVLKEGFESENRRECVTPPNHAQTNVCESCRRPRNHRLSVQFWTNRVATLSRASKRRLPSSQKGSAARPCSMASSPRSGRISPSRWQTIDRWKRTASTSSPRSRLRTSALAVSTREGDAPREVDPDRVLKHSMMPTVPGGPGADRPRVGRGLLARQWDRIGTQGRVRLDPHPDVGAAINAPALRFLREFPLFTGIMQQRRLGSGQGWNPLGLLRLRRFRFTRTVDGDRLANERLES